MQPLSNAGSATPTFTCTSSTSKASCWKNPLFAATPPAKKDPPTVVRAILILSAASPPIGWKSADPAKTSISETVDSFMDGRLYVVKSFWIIPEDLVYHLRSHRAVGFHLSQRIDFSGRIDMAVVGPDQ